MYKKVFSTAIEDDLDIRPKENQYASSVQRTTLGLVDFVKLRLKEASDESKMRKQMCRRRSNTEKLL